MSDFLKIELSIEDGNADVVIGKNKQKLEDFVNTVENAQPILKFKIDGQPFIDLDKLEKRANATRQSFSEIAKVRLDNGQVNNLTRDIVKAGERSRQLESDIKSIKNELKNPNRKSSISFLTDELRAAQTEADQLNRKLSTLDKSDLNRNSGRSGNRRGQITAAQSAVLEIADDFAPEGFNKIFNSVARAALIAQDVKDATSGMTALLGVSGTTLATFGGIAAAGAAIVIVTQKIRSEAEHRLKVEEEIQGALNRQIFANKQLLIDYKNLREQASVDRLQNSPLGDNSIESLRRRRATAEQLRSFVDQQPNLLNIKDGKLVSERNPQLDQLEKQIRDLDAQINESEKKRTKSADDYFASRNESFKKSQANELIAQEKAIAAEKKRAEELEKTRKKIEEIGKTANSTFDSLFQKSSNNQFLNFFSQSANEVEKLKLSLQGLPPELQKVALAMQTASDSNKLFDLKLSTALDAFNLRESANAFRNPSESPEARQKRIDDVVKNNISRGNFFAGGAFGTFGSNLANKAGGFDQLTAEQKRDIYEQSLLGSIGNDGGINRDSLITSLANARRPVDQNQTLNERLQKQLAIINGFGGSAEEKAIADKKLIGITGGLNPSDLTNSLREAAAAAREREAVRLEKAESDAKEDRKEQIRIQGLIAENTKRLLDIAEKDGTAGIKSIVEIIDKTNGAARVLGATPKPVNVADEYNSYQNAL